MTFVSLSYTGLASSRSFVVDTAGPSMTVLSESLDMNRRGVVKVALECPSAEANGPCFGVLNLKTVRKVKVGDTRSRVILGGREFTIASGGAKTGRIQLRGASRRLVRQAGSLGVRAISVAQDLAGNRKVSANRLTLTR